MDALSEAIVRLLRRQDETDRRLSEIEKALQIARAPAGEPTPIAEPTPVTAPETPAPPSSAISPPAPEAAPRALPADPPRLETRLGLAWVNRIGALTLALCVVFIFK